MTVDNTGSWPEGHEAVAAEGRTGFDLDRVLHWVLLIGVMASIIVMVLGLFLLALNPAEAIHRTGGIPQTIDGALHGNPIAVMTVGILLLMATPALRVVTCVLGFLAERDWVYASVALAVALVLTFSIFVAAR